jgi:branched-chain amino acid transport system substrate-binding protein
MPTRSPDYNSLVLQILAAHADAVQLMFVDDQGAQILNAVQQQDGGGKTKWTGSGALYTAPFVKAIDAKYWNRRLWIDTEQAPLDSTGPDNQNWRAMMDAYAPAVVKDVFSQMGYVTARIAEKAMMSIKNPDDINRTTVTAALQNMTPYETDIFCAPWYWGGPTPRYIRATTSPACSAISTASSSRSKAAMLTPTQAWCRLSRSRRSLASIRNSTPNTMLANSASKR